MDKRKYEYKMMQLDHPPGYSVCKVARAQILNAQAGFEPITEPTPEGRLPYVLWPLFQA